MTAQPILVIRASSLSSYHDCPRRSATRMFRKEIEGMGYELRQLGQSIGALIGTAVHAAAALTLKAKAETGQIGPTDAATDCAIGTLRENAHDGALYDRETPGLNDAEQQAVRMTKAYRSHIAPGIQPLIVEERLEAQVTPSLVLSGQSDVIAREPGRVHDLKTGKRRGNHKPQIGAYSLLARTPGAATTEGISITDAVEDFVQRVPLKKPQPTPEIHTYEVATAETAALNVLRHIEADLVAFRQGDEARGLLPGDPWSFPANPSSMLCSPKWCAAFGTDFCREHMKELED